MNTVSPSDSTPAVPEDLVRACQAGDCVLYAGAGLSAQAGYPTWHPFIRGLVDWAAANSLIPPDFVGSLTEAVDLGQVDSVADSLVSAVIPNQEGMLHDYLKNVFIKSPSLPPAYDRITGIPFTAVLTTNFDDLLERAYQGSANVLTPKDTESLLDRLSKRLFFILKLYGTLERPETVLVAPAQYEATVSGNLSFSKFMETLFFSRTILFVSASLEGIEAYLKGITLPRYIPRTHYALIDVVGSAWQAKAGSLRRRYGIETLPYRSTEGFPQVAEFLEALRIQVAEPSTATQATESSPGINGAAAGRLKRVILDNIGPFDHVELDLDPRWNILLGDNGVGKSSILRAIAVAIVGSDAQQFAGRLIKSGCTSGVIVLDTDRHTYKTELHRGTNGSEVVSLPGRPLEAEGWLAVAFPALRTVSWDRPKAPETEVKGRPTPDDLLPLIAGAPDPRLDKLKQFIVNLDYWTKDAQSRTGSGGRYERLLKEFFRIVSKLAEGLMVEFKEVRPQTNEVTIVTDDGEVPIEALSQGTTSLISWVGVLLQRLYELYGDEEQNPTEHYALVLMDELDAHMHPAWQQSLVGNLKEVFPNVQFIATTHSPLIVGGLPAGQVFRFIRDEDGKVVRMETTPDMTMGRADQVLTGPLFGLQTTLDAATLQEMDKYQQLLGMESRSEEQEEEFRRLTQVLRSRIPQSPETPAERRAQELIEAILMEQLGDVFPLAGKTVIQRAELLLDEVSRRRLSR